MASSRKNLLITGAPGVGKTTLIRRLSEALKPSHPVGFYTEEIREDRVRKGFGLATFDGRKNVLSHVNIDSPWRVGKYRVDVAGFEGFLDAIDFLSPATELIMVDEIGKMECLSQKFKNLLKDVLNSEKLVIATIALKGSGIIADAKKRRDVTLLNMTPRNRDSLLSEILMLLRK